MGQIKEAERIYRKTLDMNPNLWDIYAQFGDFLLQQNRPKEAAEIYREVPISLLSLVQYYFSKYCTKSKDVSVKVEVTALYAFFLPYLDCIRYFRCVM